MSKIPFKGVFKITCPYLQKGNLWKSGYHKGIDLVGVSNIRLYSIVSGIVYDSGYDKGGFGNYIGIKDYNTGYIVYYAHLKFCYYKKGDEVFIDDLVGIMGNTGNTTGAHTHVEIRNIVDGKINLINPALFMGIPNSVGIYNSNDFPLDYPQPVDKGGFEMKLYKNGSTKELVYSDTKLSHNIGFLNPYEACECYGIINNLALVVYNVDNTNGIKKTGFVKWLGGIK